MTTLKRAIEIARQAHAGQVDKAGEDYIEHPLRIMWKAKTEDEQIIGVLHDVVEDSDWTFEMLEEEGFSSEVIEALRCMTKLSDDEDYDHFIDRVLTNTLAMRVKLLDLEDNMDLTRLSECTEDDIRRKQKYQLAYDRIKANKLIHFLSFSVSVMSIPIDNNSIPANLAKLSSIAISYSRIDLFISE